MRNQPLLLYFLFITIISSAQDSRKIISGIVNYENSIVEDVHVQNKNTNQGTSTNNKGFFEIPVKIGDTLYFSHIKHFEKEFIITKKVILEKKVNITLLDKTYTLDEITIGKQKSILFVEPSYFPPPKVNAATLKLPYANAKPKKDNSIVKFRSGGVVSLDNLINALNGNNKREKKFRKVKYEDSILLKIRKHFTDDFFITDLNIKLELINPFLNFCKKEKIISSFNKNENLALTKVFLKESKVYLKELEQKVVLAKK